ncbi:hypothetical protein FOMG_19475 [Fusarium oxysporum f. sp. melonis 26406]|uniref:Uncharacterized protein n=1 Tax=Fusarium oxysporum f. sp. melonis 26406 TaxID=1089452 RepID=W9YW14_FUSOX|nr:hypothetical protein FOMG_19475 [Fusarium oxysporum f. sp. melonis 26406]
MLQHLPAQPYGQVFTLQCLLHRFRRYVGWPTIIFSTKLNQSACTIYSPNNMGLKWAVQSRSPLWTAYFPYCLLDTTLNLQSYVQWYQKKHHQDMRDDYLTPDEWSALGETRAFLQPFWKITQLTEGRYATLDRSLFTMDVLHKHYTQAFQKHSSNATLRSCVAASWAVFDKYYQLTDESPAYGAAIILHPSRRVEWYQET